MSQTIYKMAGRKDPFARIPNELLADDRVSWRAKGILSYLCGKPDGWKMRVADLCNHGTEGEFAVRSALKELRKAGYAQLCQVRENGKIKQWVWKVSDTAIFLDGGNQDVGKPDVGKRDHSKKESNKTDLKKKKTEATSAVADARSLSDFSAMWKPIAGTKQEKLSRVKRPKEYPSEREFDEYVDTSLLELGMGKRPDLYSTLCDRKWHHWDTVAHKWVPIRDWKCYVQALDEKMSKATAHDTSGVAFRMPHAR